MKPEYLSPSRIKSEFGLTDTQIRGALAPPDTSKQAAQRAVHTKRESAKIEAAKLVRSLELEPIVNRASVRKEAADFFFERYDDFNGEATEKGLCSFIRHNCTNYEEILSVVKGKVGASDLYVKVYLCCRIIAHYGLDVNPLHAAFPGTARSLTHMSWRPVPGLARPGHTCAGTQCGCVQDRCGERLPEGEDLEAAVARMLGIEDQS